MISTNKILGFSVARRSTRRLLVVVYWILLLLACVAFVIHQQRHGFDGRSVVFGLQFLVFITVLLGGVKAGGLVKPFRGVHFVPIQEGGNLQSLFQPAGAAAIAADSDLDERETRLRDRVHFIAYTLVRWFALALFVAYGLLALIRADWLLLACPLFFFLLTLTLWSLPQSILLWTEPDMEVPQ